MHRIHIGGLPTTHYHYQSTFTWSFVFDKLIALMLGMSGNVSLYVKYSFSRTSDWSLPSIWPDLTRSGIKLSHKATRLDLN